MHCNVPGLVQLLVHTVEVVSFTVDTAPLSTRLSNASWRKRGHGIADIRLTPEKNAPGSCIQVCGVAQPGRRVLGSRQAGRLGQIGRASGRVGGGQTV